MANSQQTYVWVEPEGKLRMSEHFSSLLFGGSLSNTILEFVTLVTPLIAMALYGDALNVENSMPFSELAIFFIICAVIRRVYNAYLEAVYFSFPSKRTQPTKEHRLKQEKDLCGRDIEQLNLLHFHDKLTILSQFALNFALYFFLPGFYPAPEEQPQPLHERFAKLILNHYVLSFGMYWAHRSLHVIPYLWENIHSVHHYAKHPLSRNTYEDHWFDNFLNTIVGHIFAQILVPLDGPTFWFSHIFRIFESLEKHSGVSCGLNLAHTAQQWLPFAQMPHHHDWHHEGFKGSNYTFTSIGGLWDCVFGTRKTGRHKANGNTAATRRDLDTGAGLKSKAKPSSFNPMLPLVALSLLVVLKLNGSLVY